MRQLTGDELVAQAEAREINPDNDVRYKRAATPRELIALRKSARDHHQKHHHRTINRFTCDDCIDAAHCLYAFDGYNTNGDCLASK